MLWTHEAQAATLPAKWTRMSNFLLRQLDAVGLVIKGKGWEGGRVSRNAA